MISLVALDTLYYLPEGTYTNCEKKGICQFYSCFTLDVGCITLTRRHRSDQIGSFIIKTHCVPTMFSNLCEGYEQFTVL